MITERFFRLDLSVDEMLRYYRGEAQVIWVRLDNGQSLQFPARHIRRWMQADGLRGRFRIRFNASQQLVDLERLGD